MSRFPYDAPDIEDRDYDEPQEAPTCNRCGAMDLEWVDIGGAKPRWRLYEGKKLHVCPPASVTEFEDLTGK